MTPLANAAGGFVVVTRECNVCGAFHTSLWCADGCGASEVICDSENEELARACHFECVGYLGAPSRMYDGTFSLDALDHGT